MLGRVVLEDPPKVREQREDDEIEEEDRHTDEALDDDEEPGRLDRQPVGDERRRDLEKQQRESDREPEGEDELARDSSVSRRLLGVLVLGGVVRGDRERPKADRKRLSQGDDATDDREPEPAVPEELRGDGPVDLGDLAVRLADGDGPAVGLRIMTPSRTACPPIGALIRPSSLG